MEKEESEGKGVADTMSEIRGDPAQLWEVYMAVSDVREEMDEACGETYRALEILTERLGSRKKKIPVQIGRLEDELAAVRRSIEKAREDDRPTDGLEASEAELHRQIAALEEKLANIRQCEKKAQGYQDQVTAVRKQCVSSLGKGGRKVNRYIRFLESILLEEDYQSYEASGGGFAESSKGRYRTMSFRGVTFYCDDSEIDPGRKDGRGRTNLARMEQGLAPVGSDGLPMNLHHVLQSEEGPIMELSESVHTAGHKQLHINTHDIPSGINRSAFNVLKSAYWKRRAAFLKRTV